MKLLFLFEVRTYNPNNLGQNGRKLFHILAQFPFTASETKIDLSPENVSVYSRVAGRLGFKCLKLKASVQLTTKKLKVLIVEEVENCKK